MLLRQTKKALLHLLQRNQPQQPADRTATLSDRRTLTPGEERESPLTNSLVLHSRLFPLTGNSTGVQ